MAIRSISLCAGVGGLDLGLHIAEPGSRSVCFVEREAYAAATLAARMEAGDLAPAPIWSDLATFDARAWRGVVHCVTSGDPCQPNSVAGKRLGADDDRWLAEHVVRIFDESGASRLFRENVTGNADGQLAYFVPALENLGCRVAVGIFSAEEVGASHGRKRLFIVADRPVANPGNRQFSEQRRRAQERNGLGPAGENLAFAPGRYDARWRGILGRDTQLKPAVCRVANGVADRVDRLRACGNGVVPLAAAYAWRTLSALLAEDASASQPVVIAA